ncbi:Chitinase [Paragonimus heterotremus]|uniref:Chitinase n=1 Tax=Paragonimus heterotremus TaxID=100268 RepID=A0A8J4T5K5_9TREM|nr:Chitinase [Paragonimus heterotremus]
MKFRDFSLLLIFGTFVYVSRCADHPIKQLISKQDWENLFPDRWGVGEAWKKEYNPSQPWYYPRMDVDYYAYEVFIAAVERIAKIGFPNFANEPGASEDDRKRELCAFLGNIAHETGSDMKGLYYREELGYERAGPNSSPAYDQVGDRTQYKVGESEVMFRPGTQNKGKVRFTSASYHGRGPLQLSWGYNYGDFSKAMFGDPQVLLDRPDKLLDYPVLGMSSAIWYWMTQPSWRQTHIPHNVIYKSLSKLQPWGFGRTIMAINGGIENDALKNGTSEKDKKVTRRITHYQNCASHFKISVGDDGEQLDTVGMSNW